MTHEETAAMEARGDGTGALVDDLTALLEDIGSRIDELRDDLAEAIDMAGEVATSLRPDWPTHAAKTEDVARHLANIRSGLEMGWRAVPDLPFET